jgi:uncharacterized protein YdhG (YjbR/CyaY superfamily)
VADQFATVDDYIASRPEAVQPVLTEIRTAVLAAVPGAGEKIAYSIPTVTLQGRNLLSYAAWATHIGVYPIPEGDDDFRAAIAPFRDAKSTARFPLKEPVPVALIVTMAGHLAREQG